MVTSTEFLLDPHLNSSKSSESVPLCENPNDIPTFIKHSRVLHKSLPKLSRKMESLTDCASNCRNKMSLDGEEPFDCHGFSFLGRQGDNKCEFYENHLLEYSLVDRSNYMSMVINCFSSVFISSLSLICMWKTIESIILG